MFNKCWLLLYPAQGSRQVTLLALTKIRDSNKWMLDSLLPQKAYLKANSDISVDEMDTHMRITIFNSKHFNGRKFLLVGCWNKSSVNTLPITEQEMVTKEKLQGVLDHVKSWVMSSASKETIPSAVFHLYLKYQNKITMTKLVISIKFQH